ncbi:TPR-like protein [Cylindrobasidium torrendii FP15055 ss-10]|uniref:TPR-like protein n=1 Tax=Cylindrobasidium torrendii FP15055 ss-10 TaxID=1314674 RepID=A0A0D7BS73_9AGAR|nr:TPR-like protein [Cylindrobasidium torrendii FP15055 ss-10]
MATLVDAYFANDLRVAVRECNCRGLTKGAQWASELLITIPERKRTQRVPDMTVEKMYPDAGYLPGVAPSAPIVQSKHWKRDLDLAAQAAAELIDQDRIALGRAALNRKDYGQTFGILHDAKSLKAQFMVGYALYLSGMGALERKHRIAKFDMIRFTLVERLGDAAYTDPFLMYLYGLVHAALDLRAEAIEFAIKSIVGFPYNWCAWELLADCIRDVEELYSISYLLPLSRDHVLRELFHIKKVTELQAGGERELSMTMKLLGPGFFPNNPWLYSLRGSILYYMHDLPASQIEFEHMLNRDPWRVDSIDIYSFALHVTQSDRKLSRLSREYLLLAKDRPEVCCLVANFFSLQGRSDLATIYFKRAADLEPKYISAWTLMGHELIEQKNSHAAIHTYRRAIEIQRDDFRAWYGLGQAYELLNMHQLALYYYERAVSLSAYDLRMWLALGSCYEELGRFREALDCYRRALIPANPHDDFVLLKIAKVHAELGEDGDAAAYHRRVVEISQANGREVPAYAKSAIEVANYQMVTPNGDKELAKELLTAVSSSNAEDVEVATNLLKKLQLTAGSAS